MNATHWKRLTLGLLLALSATMASLYLFTPRIATWGLKQSLPKIGIHGAELQVTRLTLNQMEIAPLRLPHQGLEARRVLVSYDMEALRNMRVKSLLIEGSTTTLRQQGGVWKHPLTEVHGSPDASTGQKTANPVPSKLPPLPFSRLELLDTTLHLKGESQPSRIHGDLILTRQQETLFHLQGSLQEGTNHLTLETMIDPGENSAGPQITLSNLKASLKAGNIAGYPLQSVRLTGDFKGTPDQFQSRLEIHADLDGPLPETEMRLHKARLHL